MTIQDIIEYLEDQINYETERQGELHDQAFSGDITETSYDQYRYGTCVGSRVICESLLSFIRSEDA